MSNVIPTVFVRRKKDFDERFKKLVKVSNELQVDFMDGKFVKNKGIMPKDIPNLKKYKNKFEAHLMVNNPERYFDMLKKKGFSKIMFHYEAVPYGKIDKMIEKIKKMKLEVFIALNPETSPVKLLPFLNKINGVLIMGVNPGKEHQKFITKIYGKIKLLRELDKKIIIQIDGGVNLDVARKLKKAGADKVNSGSFVAEAEKPKRVIEKLNRILSR